MVVTLTHHGVINVDGEYFHEYTVVGDNGVVFDTREEEYYKTGTRLDIPDDLCSEDSGWLPWHCNMCGWDWWLRSRPGGVAHCPTCGEEETIPSDIKMLPFEGAKEIDRLIAENEL